MPDPTPTAPRHPPVTTPRPKEPGPTRPRRREPARLLRPISLPGGGLGTPLVPAVAGPIAASLGVDVSPVRVHSDAAAVAGSTALGARAFALGNHVFLGRGERPTDMPLIAHEVAHVVQQQATPRVQLWTPGGADPFEREARGAALAVVQRQPFTVRHRTPPRVQRLGISDALDYFADKANLIPGYRMFTIILGVNPINLSKVDRSAANILRAIVEFLPGGALITEALDKYGVFEKVGHWVEQQISTLGLTWDAIKQAIDQFLDSLSWRDIFHLGDVWDRAKRIFTVPIQRIKDFIVGLIDGIITFVREAILKPIAHLAEGTRGWDLLIAVMGKNPITGEAVPRNADTLVGGFLKLINQQEVYENMKKSNALGRAWNWFQSAINALIGFVAEIPSLFIAALKSLEWSDIVLLPRAFAKVASVFGGFLGRFITWAGNALWNLLEIIFDVVSPTALMYIKRTGAALKSILKNPLPFMGNLVKAGKQGFVQFAANFLEHLKAGLLDLLNSLLPGVYIPKSLTFSEIVKFVFSILGISWQNIRQKLVKVIGETAMKVLETGFDIVVKLVTEGPAAAWEQIKNDLSNLKDTVIGGIIDFVVDTVVTKAIPKLLSLFIPGAGFITAILTIWDTIKVFIQKLSKIVQVVTAFIDSIVRIAAGDIGSAAKRVESALASILSLAIAFLANFFGAGKLADKLLGVIKKLQAAVDKGLDKVVEWIVSTAKRLGKLVAQAGVPQDPNERIRLAAQAATAAARRLAGGVTQAALQPVLQVIQTRYSLREIRPFQRDGRWWVTVTANPSQNVDTGVPTTGANAPAAAAWPVAVGDAIRVPDSARIETVLSLNVDNTLTHSVNSGGAPGRSTKSFATFMSLWNSGAIRRGGSTSAADQRDTLTRLYGASVADAIMSRRDLATNLGILDPQQAHHIIPIELLGKQAMLRLLVNSGWDFNAKVNGLPLKAGFHGNHPQYTRYVNQRIDAWVQQNGSAPVATFQTFVESTLIPGLTAQIATALRQSGSTQENLNDYFARL